MINRLLIANRGEIVIRIARTARAMGIATVAVYSDADRGAPHVRACDEAVYLGPTPAPESYLSIEKVIAAARRVGADAIHPGYGFLSERAEFARAVVDAGLVFVGPTGDVMDRMGRKDHARDIAVAAGVPVVPSYAVPVSFAGVAASVEGGAASVERGAASVEGGAASVEGGAASVERSRDLPDDAFPVLVKAAAGGGGKGMRVVREPGELGPAIAAARREAASAFGDDTLLIETYVARGRHVEVQVLADEHGHVVHLFERDCSSQRRHQKVLEEAPAPTISAEVRDLLTGSAVALATEVGYTNAGTVEFLVDPERGTDGVYFLEMNTRLQVEHPVTEAVARVGGAPIDLVEAQLRIAAGEELGFGQSDVTCEGHALEARIYAEDAFGGFLPQAGTADLVRWSTRSRNDHALESGQVVGSSYDPMLGKVIVHGSDRSAAIDALVTALDETAILGLVTNTGFVRQLAASEAFDRCEVDTAWLDRHAEQIQPAEGDVAALFATACVAAIGVDRGPSALGAGDGWRLAGPAAPVHVDLVHDGAVARRQVYADRIVGPDGEVGAHVVSAQNHVLGLELDGNLRRAVCNVTRTRVEVAWLGQTHSFDRPVPGDTAGSGGEADGALLAKMPGTVLAVNVAEGDRVSLGDVLGVLEAMKMELALTAPYDGVVSHVGVVVGDQVPIRHLLFNVEETSE